MTALVKPWTEEADATLRRMATAGASAREIAEAVQRTRSGVIGRAHRKGIDLKGTASPSTWTIDRTADLRRMAEDGATTSEIAEALGVSVRGVRKKAHLAGIVIGAAPEGEKQDGRGRHSAAAAVEKRLRARLEGKVEEPRLKQIATMQTNAAERMKAGFVDGADPVTLLELRAFQCRWPHGEPGTEEFRFCGAPQKVGSPYCAHHHGIAYTPAVASVRAVAFGSARG